MQRGGLIATQFDEGGRGWILAAQRSHIGHAPPNRQRQDCGK